MPLQDHFGPPIWPKRDWHSFHNAWATSIAAALNAILPSDYFAEPNVQFGIEIDVGTFEECSRNGSAGASTEWRPPVPTLTIDLPIVEDIVEVGIFHPTESTRLVAAIELVSPSNKDHPASRDAFVSKCVTYIQKGLGVLIVDIVTERHADLHRAILQSLGHSETPGTSLYAVSYHPASQERHQHCLKIWYETLQLKHALPTLPLCLLGGPYLQIDLESSYERTRREMRVGINGH